MDDFLVAPSKSPWLKSQLSPGLGLWMYTRAGLKSWMQHSASQDVSIHLRPSSHRACLLSQSTSESRGLHGLSHHDWKKGASNEETRQPTPPAIGPASKPKVRILVCQHCVLCVTRAEPRLSGVKGRPGSSPWLPQPGCHPLPPSGVVAWSNSRNQPYKPSPECDGTLDERDRRQSDRERSGFGDGKLSGATWHTSHTSHNSRTCPRKRGARE